MPRARSAQAPGERWRKFARCSRWRKSEASLRPFAAAGVRARGDRQYATGTARARRRFGSERRDLLEAGVCQPGRLGEGPSCLAHRPRCACRWTARPEQDAHRRDERKHRRRLLAHRCRIGAARNARHAEERHQGSQRHHASLRHRAHLQRPDGGLRRRHPSRARDRRQEPGDLLLRGSVLEPLEPRCPTTTARAWRSSTRSATASPIS